MAPPSLPLTAAALLGLVMAVALAAPAAKVTCNIAAVVPLTGDMGDKGQAAINGAKMAIKEFSNENVTINLIAYDDACDPKMAAEAMTKAVDTDKVQGVIGAYCSGASLAASKIANDKKVPMISPTSTSPRLTMEGGPFFFRLAPSDIYQGKVMGELVARKAKKVGLVYSNEAYGEAIAHELFVALNKAGIPVVGSVGFGDEWVPGTLGGILGGGADTVILASNKLEQAQKAGQELRDSNFTGSFFFTDSLTDNAMLDGPEPGIFDGTVGISLFTGSPTFRAKYKAAYNTTTVPQGAAGAYDAARLFLKVCAADGKALPGSAIQPLLLKAKIPWGATGPNVGFDANGDVKGVKYEFLRAAGPKWVPWTPPPARRSAL